MCVKKLLIFLTSIENSLSTTAPQSSVEATTSQPSLPNSVAYDDIEMQAKTTDQVPIINAQNQVLTEWGKFILGYCFASSIALLALYFQIQPHDVPLSFYVLSTTLLISFSASLLAQALSLRFPILAEIHEQVGFGFAVLNFFIAIEIILPWSIKWVAWIVCPLSLFLSFILYNHSHNTY